MSLEELISKYLDSDLTYEEDKLLRSYVTSDTESKEKFDASVTLHYAMREDAEGIITPRDVVKETEDKILMMILNEPPVVMPSVKRIRRIPSMALLTALFLIFLVIQINEPVIEKEKKNIVERFLRNDKAGEVTSVGTKPSVADAVSMSSGDIEMTENLTDRRIPESRLTSTSSVTGTLSSEGTGEGSSITYLSDRNGIEMYTDELESSLVSLGSFDDNMLPQETISEFIDGIITGISRFPAIESDLILPVGKEIIDESNATLAGNESVKEIMNEDEKSRNLLLTKSADGYNLSASPVSTRLSQGDINTFQMINAFDDIKSSDEVQLTTFFGTDFFRGGLNISQDQPVSHVAQSVSYSIDENSRIGIEVGYTQYSYNDNFDIKVPIGKSLNSGRFGNNSEIEVKNANPGEYDYISYSMAVERTKKMFWGAIFYEMSFYNNYGLSLNSRAGLGSSGEGMLGYGRIFGKYELLPGLYATLGIDGRLFYTTLQMLSQNSAGVKSSASLIYGLQLKF